MRECGITFRHTDGSSGQRYIIESMTGGVALFDYDNDGDLDVHFLNGAPLRGSSTAETPVDGLYRNDGQWQFSEVTGPAGVGDRGYGMGVAVADFDNDGFADVYVNNFGPNTLYRNNGDGTFQDVSQVSGVTNGDRVGAGICFLDIDGNGDLDLYVGNYLQFSYEKHKPHTYMGLPSYPSPLNYAPDPDTVFRSNGDGSFADVTVESGIAGYAENTMGTVCADYDDDGDTDIFVANDVQACSLYQNDGKGHFIDTAILAGVAYDMAGTPHGNMGVDAGDFDNDGLVDFHVTSYAGELAVLFRNLGQGIFEDVTRTSGAGQGTLPHVTWGNAVGDFDNDGHRDLFIACGHVDDNVEQRDDTTAYHVPNILLRNTGQGTFVDVSRTSGEGMLVSLSSRGAALGDLDQDGDLDIVVQNSRREPTILRNESTAANHWLRVCLRGVRASRDGVGAKVRVTAGDLVQVDEVRSGRGYQSHFDLGLHFGLRDRQQVDCIEVRWLGGAIDRVTNVRADRTVVITEGSGR